MILQSIYFLETMTKTVLILVEEGYEGDMGGGVVWKLRLTYKEFFSSESYDQDRSEKSEYILRIMFDHSYCQSQNRCFTEFTHSF